MMNMIVSFLLNVYQLLFYPVLLWLIFLALHKLIQILFPEVYKQYIDREGVTIKPFYIKFSTTALNKFMHSIGNVNSSFLHIWFSMGVVFGLIAMASSVILLIVNLFFMLTAPTKPPLLTPVLPGVNIPNSQLPYYFFALLISGVVHELGHGIAAISERQRIDSFGGFLILLYPGVFVDMQRCDLMAMSSWSALKIVCAGVWHNFILALLAWCLILSGPLLSLPLYRSTNGVLVTYVNEESFPMLHQSQTIIGVNDCEITSKADWDKCFANMYTNNFQPLSYCNRDEIPQTAKIKYSDEISAACCDIENYNGSLQCWSYQSKQDGLQKKFCYSAHLVVSDDYCIPSQTSQPAETESDKQNLPNEDTSNWICATDEICYTPLLRYPEMILKIQLGDGTYSLIAGNPFYLYQSIMITEYQLRDIWTYINADCIIPLYLPDMFEKMMWYICSISAALSLLNIAPTYMLDGSYACFAFMRLFGIVDAAGYWNRFRIRYDYLINFIFRTTIALFVSNIIVSLATVGYY